MGVMFFYNLALTTILVSNNFVVGQVTSSRDMFNRCFDLVGGGGTPFNSNYVDKTYARIDNPPDAPGYFTLKQ